MALCNKLIEPSVFDSIDVDMKILNSPAMLTEWGTAAQPHPAPAPVPPPVRRAWSTVRCALCPYAL
jgi:hypothetical protein